MAQQDSKKTLKSLSYYLGVRKTAVLTHSLVEMVQEAGKGPLACRATGRGSWTRPSLHPNAISKWASQWLSASVLREKHGDQALCGAEEILAIVREHYRVQGEGGILAGKRE